MFRSIVRLSTPLLRNTKTATNVVGYPVVPNAREVLVSLYKKTLNDIQGIPATEGYHKHVTAFTNYRLRVVENKSNSIESIESEINCGQIEELIEQAENELKLLEEMKSRFFIFLFFVFYFLFFIFFILVVCRLVFFASSIWCCV